MFTRGVIRSFSSASAATNATRTSNPLVSTVEEKVSRLPNGFTVASIDLQGAVSQLIIAYRAGTRYEQHDEAGLVHHLRNCIGTDSANYMGLKMLWQSGNIGSTITTDVTRDLVSIRTYANVALSLLGELSQPAFKAWDVNDSAVSLDHEVQSLHSYDYLLENLHKAAFREGPLGNFVNSPQYRVGKVSHQSLANFAKSRLVSSNASLVAINVDHSGSIPNGSAKAAEPSFYIGGERRFESDGYLAHVAIAGEGAQLKDTKSVAVHSVLGQLIGKGSQLKFSYSPGFGIVSNNIVKAANHNHVEVKGLNVVYSDAGLTGIHIVADGNKIGPYIKAAVDSFRGLASGSGINDETLTIAKKLAQVEENVASETSFKLATKSVAHLLANGALLSPTDFVKEIENVTVDDIKKAASKLVSKLSISSVGKIHQVPYLDQL